MSIYRTLERSPQSDVHHVTEHVAGPHKSEQREATTSPEQDWTSRRKAAPAEVLLPTTVRWMVTLPFEAQPRVLSRAFPRIVNTLAMLWTSPEALTNYFSDLFVDKRSGRQGFPFEALEDLQRLSAYHATLHPDREVVWDEPGRVQ